MCGNKDQTKWIKGRKFERSEVRLSSQGGKVSWLVCESQPRPDSTATVRRADCNCDCPKTTAEGAFPAPRIVLSGKSLFVPPKLPSC